MVVTNNGSRIGGINDTPDIIGFFGYLHSKQPEEKIKERMDHFKDQAKQLMRIRESGHPSDDKSDTKGAPLRSTPFWLLITDYCL